MVNSFLLLPEGYAQNDKEAFTIKRGTDIASGLRKRKEMFDTYQQIGNYLFVLALYSSTIVKINVVIGSLLGIINEKLQLLLENS